MQHPAATDEPPSARVLDDEMLLSSIIDHVPLLAHRLCLREVSMHFQSVVGSPHVWRAMRLEGCNGPLCPRAPIPRQQLASLQAVACKLPTASLNLSMPNLVELSLCGSTEVDEFLLRACFGQCGQTLRRLNLSAVTMQPVRPGPDLFDDLVHLEVLVARGVEGVDGRPVHPNRVPGSWVLQAVTRCPELESLILGWPSEFIAPGPSELLAAPFLEPRFSEPVLVLPIARDLAEACPKLRALTLSGYALLYDQFVEGAFAATALESLDLCGCQLSTDEGLAAALATCAHSLRDLNVRGTRFGDESAAALVRGGCSLERLNASCTRLTSQGLLMLSDASDRLQVVDVCYAKSCCEAEAMRTVCARHGSRLQMLGMGGCAGLGTDDLTILLELTKGEAGASSLQHLGIGGCESLHGASALADVIAACGPTLTALSAHKLERVTWNILASLLERCPNLASLDLAGSEPSDPGASNDDAERGRESTFKRLWADRCAEGRVKAGRVDEFFVERTLLSQVIRTDDPVVICPAPKAEPSASRAELS